MLNNEQILEREPTLLRIIHFIYYQRKSIGFFRRFVATVERDTILVFALTNTSLFILSTHRNEQYINSVICLGQSGPCERLNVAMPVVA